MSATPGQKKIPIHVQSSQHRIHIKGGKVVNDDGIIDADVFIEEGVIKQVGPNLIVPGGCRVVEARGHYVIPGGIDPHTHFDTSFMSAKTADDFYHGTRAALAGGTTTIINHAISQGVGPVESFRRFKALADGKACCDYALHVAITDYKDGQTDRDMEALIREGVNSFKIFMAYKDSLQLVDGQIIKVFDACKRLGVLPLVHAENGDVIDFLSRKLITVGVTGPEGHLQSRPEDVEAEATHRAITMADQIGVPLYIVHVMSKSAADEINRGRARGAVIFGETVTAALGADGTHVFNRCWQHAAAHVMSPPIREDKTTAEYLTNLLGSGQLQVTGSDHCVFLGKDKALGEKDFRKIPNGVNGVEERLAIIWEKGVKAGKLSVPDFVAVTSANAAKIFNMYPKKGRIAPGSDADVVVWGRKPGVISKSTHHSSVDFNIFEGLTTEFNPIVVIAGGRVVLDEEGRLQTIQGSGKYIPRTAHPHIAFSRLIQRDLNLGPIKVDRSAAAVEATKAGDVRNGAAGITPKKPIGSPLSIVTNLDNIRVSDAPHSPGGSSSGSLTPTGFHKIQTRSGVRSQQDSGFKLTGQQIDDDRLGRTSVKLHQPPGGKSSGIW